MAIADFHCHVSFKPTLALPADRPDCWFTINSKLLSKILDSQSNMQQLVDGGVNLVFATVYGLEPGVAKQFLLHTLDPAIPVLDRRQLIKLRDGKVTSNAIVREEILALRVDGALPGKAKQAKIITSVAEYDPTDDSTIHLVLNMEGGHNLYGARNAGTDENTLIAHLNWFKKADNPRLLYFTMAHLEDNTLCTHASGIKIFGKKSFLPKGRSITPLGYRLAEIAMADTGRKIYIDTRHMSLESRMDFHTWKSKPTSAFKNEPVLCSHAGVTGASWGAPMPITSCRHKRNGQFFKLKYNPRPGVLVPGTNFNPCSINLYDEEILLIAKSGGLIGVSLDIRILGGKVKGLKECVTIGEKYLFPTGNMDEQVSAAELFDQEDRDDERDEPFEQYTAEEKSPDFGMRHLVNNILHIVKVCTDGGIPDPWAHVVLGSDYDGLIEPIGGYPNAASLGGLAADIEAYLRRYAPAAGINIPDPKAAVGRFMHGNAHAFLIKHFQ